jgi:acyl carrier protein
MNATEERVTALIVEMFLDGDESFPLTADMDLLEEGVCDSLGFIQLAAELEQVFPGVSIDDADIGPESMSRITDIAALVAPTD